MTNEKLIALLREARERADSVDSLGDDLERRIDAALDEPVEEVHAACGRVHRNGAVCILETVLLVRERTAERDEARAEVERLRAALAARSERPVTWECEPDGKFVKGYRADSLQIIITRLVSGRCEWNAWLDWEDDGEAATVEEAQAAAIKAVKEAW